MAEVTTALEHSYNNQSKYLISDRTRHDSTNSQNLFIISSLMHK